jgi:hypothetical protein
MTDQSERGQLTPNQVRKLLEAVKPYRVKLREGHSHMEGYDVRAHLTRIFGFEGWDLEGEPAQLIQERELDTGRKKDSGWPIVRYSCAYRQTLTLVVYDQSGRVVKRVIGQAVGKAEDQPSFGDAHDLALKDAETQALKRAAMNLGDQFGLGLYNKKAADGQGGYKACVKVTLVRMPEADDGPELETPEVGEEGDDARRAADDQPESATAPERNGRDLLSHVTHEDVTEMKATLAHLEAEDRKRLRAEREELGLSVEWGDFNVGTLHWILNRAAELSQLREATAAALAAEPEGVAQRGLATIVAVEKDGRRYEPAPGGGMVDVGPAGQPEQRAPDAPTETETRAEARRRAGGMKLAPKAQRDAVAKKLGDQTPEVRGEVEEWAAANGHTLGDQLQADSVNVVTQAITNIARAHKLKGRAQVADREPEVERRAERLKQWEKIVAAVEILGPETWDMVKEELEGAGIAGVQGTHVANWAPIFVAAPADKNQFLTEMAEQYHEVAVSFQERPFETVLQAPTIEDTTDY